ncbi:uncharacterized protein LOC144921561 isoform X2 [Branchiostoma floridae x Branchiostoma belcheri]
MSRRCGPGQGFDPNLGCRDCASCVKYAHNPHCGDCLSASTTITLPFGKEIKGAEGTGELFQWQLIAIGVACGVVLVLAIAVFIRYTRRRDKTPRAMEHGISVDSLTGETMAVEESSAYTSSEMSSSGSSMASIHRETVI